MKHDLADLMQDLANTCHARVYADREDSPGWISIAQFLDALAKLLKWELEMQHLRGQLHQEAQRQRTVLP